MERYEKPEMEVIVFDEEEIRTSINPGNTVSSNGLGDPTPMGNSF